MQCQCHRGNYESFPAEVWFSTYRSGQTAKLAAIIADVTEEGTAIDGSDDSEGRPGRVPLNSRETEVLRLLLQGLANKQIASRLSVSECTVKNTFQQLFLKTNVRSRSQLVRVALENYRDLL